MSIRIPINRLITYSLSLLTLSLLVFMPLLMPILTARAEAVTWANTSLRAEVIRNGTADYKKCYETKVRVSGYVVVQPGCYWTNDAYRFGYFSPSNYNYGTAAMVSFGADSQFYMIDGLDGGTYQMLPNSKNIIKWFNTGMYTTSACLIRDLPSRLTRTTTPFSGTTYKYDGTGCTNILMNRESPADISKWSISPNGKWIVMGAREGWNGVGAYIVDVDTLQGRRIETNSIWSPGENATLAISNDGRSVAIGKGDARYKPGYIKVTFYTITGTCGQMPPRFDNAAVTNQGSLCPSQTTSTLVSVTADTYSTQFRYLNDSIPMVFGDNDTSLTLSVHYNNDKNNGQGEDIPIKIKRSDYVEPKQLDYLALGDSISSGEGDTDKNPATDKKYYRLFTNEEENKAAGQPREKCHQSTRSYPYLLASWMNLTQGPKAQWDSVACSGAKSDDIADTAGNLYEYQGQDNRLAGYSTSSTLQSVALNMMIPGRIEQIEFVKKYKPKVITLTTGGNDIDFGGKAYSCITGIPTCSWANTDKPRLGSQIEREYDRLKTLYSQLNQASGGQSKIYVVGYPRLVNDFPVVTCGANIGALDTSEREMMGQATDYLNATIESAANAAGVHYVNISHSLDGGMLCDDGQKYVTGVVSPLANDLQESFHPNSVGQATIAAAIKKELGGRSLIDYQVCPTAGINNCPKTDVTAQKPVRPAAFTDAANSANVALTSNKTTPRGGNATITLPRYMVNPVTKFVLDVHSTPQQIATVESNSDGSLNATVKVPDNLPAGYHTLVLKAQTYSGEPIEYTQTILVTGADPTDYDANGVADKTQKCGAFITPSGKDADLDGIDDACDPQITAPVWYAARNGLAVKGEDPAKLYLLRNVRAYDYTRVYGDWVDRSKDPSNNFAYVASSLTEDTKATYNKLMYTWSGQQPIPIVLTKDKSGTCIALKPNDLTMAWNWTSPYYKLRGFTKLTALPTGGKCE